MLKLEKLFININNTDILFDINISINNGDIVAILGPNGHGKSTLLKSIMGHYTTQIKSGKILFNNLLLNEMLVNERADNGIFLANQNPIEIPGISNLDFYKSIINTRNKKINIGELFKLINKNLERVGLKEEVLKRSINDGFSGGEKKKNEIMQMLLLEPKLIMLDEIDSGLDIDSINNITKIIKEEFNEEKILMYITHNDNFILNLKPNKVILIANGKIIKIGDYELAKEIYKVGYDKYLKNNNIIISNKEKVLLNSCKVKKIEK